MDNRTNQQDGMHFTGFSDNLFEVFTDGQLDTIPNSDSEQILQNPSDRNMLYDAHVPFIASQQYQYTPMAYEDYSMVCIIYM